MLEHASATLVSEGSDMTIPATEYVVTDESGPWLRRGKPPVFIATIQSPRTLEGWQRNRLQAQIIKVVPNAHVVVW